jgi:hypothetical protein
MAATGDDGTFTVTREQYYAAKMRDPAFRSMANAGARLVACRALGLPYPPPDEHRPAVVAKAAALIMYDRECSDVDMYRWMPGNHDPGDEDRSER